MSAGNKRRKEESAKIRDIARVGSDVWDDDLGRTFPVEGPWLAVQLKRLISRNAMGYEDNQRACVVGDTAGEAEYDRRLRKGCCGFCDVTLVHPKTGRKFKLGFNGGH